VMRAPGEVGRWRRPARRRACLLRITWRVPARRCQRRSGERACFLAKRSQEGLISLVSAGHFAVVRFVVPGGNRRKALRAA
jgi:hypothetical protein